MKIALCTLVAVALAAQPLMLQAAQAQTSNATSAPAKPATPATPKVAGTKAAVGAGVSMKTVGVSLLIGGAAVAALAGAGGGGKDGTTGTTGTTGTR